MRNVSILFLAFAVLAVSSLHAQSRRDLFSVAPSNVPVGDDLDRKLDELRTDPLTEHVTHVRLGDAIEVATDFEFEMQLAPDLRVVARTRGITRNGSDEIFWQGTIGEDATIVSLLLSDGNLMGRFRANNQEWRIQPLGLGEHALVALDSDYSSEDYVIDFPWPGAGDPSVRSYSKSESSSGSSSLSELSIIDIMVVYSDDAGAAVNMPQAAAAWVADLQGALNNGGLGNTVLVDLVHTMQVTVSEPVTLEDALDDLVAGNSPYGGVSTARAAYGADIVVLALEDVTGGKGLANDIFAQSPSDAFAVVKRSYADGVRTALHEIGHLVGGLHTVAWMVDQDPGYDPDDDPANIWGTVSYAHGIGTGPSTIMATDGTRVQHFSQDDTFFPNTSTPMGGDYENNVQVWANNASTLANLVDADVEEENPPYVLTASLSGPVELAWKDYATYSATKLYVPSEGANVDCTECLIMWYERYSPTGPWYFTGITTTTLYMSMVWSEGHGYGIVITDGIQLHDAEIWVDYCEYGCGGGAKRVAESEGLPLSVSLRNPFPNPSASSVRISYATNVATQVELTVFDVIGRRLETLVDGKVEKGDHSVLWTLNNLPSGIYVVSLRTNGQVISKFVALNR